MTAPQVKFKAVANEDWHTALRVDGPVIMAVNGQTPGRDDRIEDPSDDDRQGRKAGKPQAALPDQCRSTITVHRQRSSRSS